MVVLQGFAGISVIERPQITLSEQIGHKLAGHQDQGQTAAP